MQYYPVVNELFQNIYLLFGAKIAYKYQTNNFNPAGWAYSAYSLIEIAPVVGIEMISFEHFGVNATIYPVVYQTISYTWNTGYSGDTETIISLPVATAGVHYYF